jgi:hypothetical protein
MSFLEVRLIAISLLTAVMVVVGLGGCTPAPTGAICDPESVYDIATDWVGTEVPGPLTFPPYHWKYVVRDTSGICQVDGVCYNAEHKELAFFCQIRCQDQRWMQELLTVDGVSYPGSPEWFPEFED